jgi:hypothetical protein
MGADNALAQLDADLRLLSSESRRADSLTGQLTGWLSGPEHPQIKESAERAMLRLRSMASSDDAETAAKHRKVLHLCLSAAPHVSSARAGCTCRRAD